MRIALDLRECTNPLTGMGRYGLAVTRELAHSTRHRYLVLLPPGATLPAPLRGLDVEALWASSPAYAPGEHFELPAILARAKADHLHAMTYTLPLRASISTSLTLFDVVPLLFPEGYRLRAHLYWRWVLPRTLARASRIVTLSEASRRDILAHFALAPDKVAVLPAGVDPSFCSAEPDQRVLRRLGIDGSYVLVHNARRPHKNMAALRAAFELLAATHPELGLVISGGPGTGRDGRVVDTGVVDDPTLVELYRGARMLVVPSLYEGAGLTPLEAMGCGIPCVVSDRGALPDLYGSAALVSAAGPETLAAAIARLDRDEALRADLITRGLALAHARPWSRAATALEQLLEAAMGT